MFNLWKNKVIKRGMLPVFMLGLIILPVILTTCQNAVGFGNSIDFEPPILTLDPGPNPRYVSQRTVLTGTATDNIAVEKVICRDATNPGIIYGTASLRGDRWSMTMNFTEADNGRKIPVEIVAFDKMGNSGERSIQTISLIVDLHPPIFDELLIWRNAAGRTEPLENLNDLKALETSDPYGERSENVDRYQNGTFWFRAQVTENETTVKTIVLNVYDADHDAEGQEIYSEVRDLDSSAYSPQWTIKETDLVNAGEAKGWNYRQRATPGNNGRIYLRVSVVAMDMADNTKTWREDYGYFCLYQNADNPKAVVGGGKVQFVEVGTPLHVEIFDDDNVQTAYVALMKREDFNNILPGASDQATVEKLKDKLVAGDTVLDYKGDQITNCVAPGTTPESFMVDISAGRFDSDFGEYVLIGIVQDVKSPPHDSTDDSTGWKPVWGCYPNSITVTDNSAPLIVIDTVDTTITSGPDKYDPLTHPGSDTDKPLASTGNSPEENTFPKLLAPPSNGVIPIPPFKVIEPGRYFTINGYTLRAKNVTGSTPPVKVTTFRMAWIPYDNGNQDSYVNDVKNALSTDSYNWSALEAKGIQYWTLSDSTNTSNTSYWTDGSDQLIGEITYTKQAFFKRFDILGVDSDGHTLAYDDLKGQGNGNYRNFYVNDPTGTVPENEPKLFVFYAKDADGHEAFRTIRLLGNKTPPALQVYDFTKRSELSGLDQYIPTVPDYNDGIQQPLYKSISGRGDNVNFTFSGKTIGPVTIPTFGYTDADLAETYKAYPSGQIHKLYVTSKEGDDRGVQIDNISMYDITEAPAGNNTIRGNYNATNRDLTYIAALPDILQRTFLFTATNRLGVGVQIQRTVAVTSTAQLKEIITDKVSGTTYGAGTPITLQAQFSAPVMVKTTGPTGPVPLMNIRYQVPDGTTNSVLQGGKYWIYDTIPFSGTPVDGLDPPINASGYSKPSLYLDFTWAVPEGAQGVLETIDITNASTSAVPNKERVIDLNGADIFDAERVQDEAFLPGYVLTEWHDGLHSLQGNAANPGKNILLDGIKPKVISFAAGGKDPYTALEYYYKAGETVTFTLTANKPIRTSGNGNPRIQFQIKDAATQTVYPTSTTYYNADYKWPAGNSTVVFDIDIDSIPLAPPSQLSYGGTIINVGLSTTNGGIIDSCGNSLDVSAMVLVAGTQLVVDKTPPPNATPRLGDSQDAIPVNPPSSTSVTRLNYNPILSISNIATSTQEPWGTSTQYSLDGGLSWGNYPSPVAGWTDNSDGNLRIVRTQNGATWRLQTRQIDRAGNVSAVSPIYELDINGVFPKLIFINVQNPTGIYTQGPITLTLDFEASVVTTVAATDPNFADKAAYILVSDTTANSKDSTQQHTAKVFAQRQTVENSTLTFTWNPLTGKQMPYGITITEIRLNGDVEDAYKNPGVNSYSTAIYGTSAPHGQVTMYKDASDMPSSMTASQIIDKTYPVDNLNGAGVKIFTIPPKLTDTNPKNASPTGTGTPSGVGEVASAVLLDRKTIILTFDNPVRKEMGTIHIKPHGDFPIPPVFPATGYTDTDGTYVESFYEVYNSPNIDAYASISGNPSASVLRGYLLQGSYQDPDLDPKFGLGMGPYKPTTQGLKTGAGYAAAAVPGTTPDPYTDTAKGWVYDPEAVGWNPVPKGADSTEFMVPDTSTKYVLDFQYPINSTDTAVANIRKALNAAHFRWRDIDVISDEVTIVPDDLSKPNIGTVVKVILNDPLPVGFSWDLFYDTGTFTNEAGIPVSAITEGAYWFWTSGVQKPVIRVDRKSMDYRNAADRKGDTSANANQPALTYSDPPSDNRGKDDFGSVNYRIECETPGAMIMYNTLSGAAGDYDYGRLEMSTSGSISNATSGSVISAPTTIPLGQRTWDSRGANQTGANPVTDTMGTWVLPNLVRRAVSAQYNGVTPQPGLRYNVTTNGLTVTNQGQGSYWGFRSYNRDATLKQLTDLDLSQTVQNMNNTISLGGLKTLMASKNYVVAQASKTIGTTSTSARGYEGIFKTIVYLNTPNASAGSNPKVFGTQGSTPVQIFGSNIQAPSASIAGFPMMLQNSDLRFLKFPYGGNSGGTTAVYWISTEIMSSWYISFCTVQNNSSIMSRCFQLSGEAGFYTTGSYGDLTYSYMQDYKN